MQTDPTPFFAREGSNRQTVSASRSPRDVNRERSAWIHVQKPAWSWRRDLNPQPADYKSAALPIELRQRLEAPTMKTTKYNELILSRNTVLAKDDGFLKFWQLKPSKPARNREWEQQAFPILTLADAFAFAPGNPQKTERGRQNSFRKTLALFGRTPSRPCCLCGKPCRPPFCLIP